MNKKIYFLFSFLVIGLGLLSYRITYGFFVDNEISTGNTFAAATEFPSSSPTFSPSPSETTSPSPSVTPSPSVSPSPSPTSEPFVDAVESSSGTFGHCCSDLSSDPSVAASLVTGQPDSPPDADFIQLSDNTVITFKFVNNKAIDGTGADIRVYVYDSLFEAFAKIEVSADGTTFVEASPSQPDTANFDIDLATLSPPLTEATYIRFTDLVGDTDFPQLGYDLDAIEALNSVSVP